MIPEAKQAAVARALREAFTVEKYDDIRPLTAGMSSALVFRIVVRGNPYLLRLIMPGALGDPVTEFACMQAAAAAGVAPRVRYANTTDRLLITDFVEAKPYPDDLPMRIAPVLRRLHSLPQFPKPRVVKTYFDAIDGFIRRFQAAKILPESKTEELFRSYAELAKVYPRNEAELVASHNDLKPQNILFDGAHVWLVDWEAAFLNDRYLDLAVVANFFVQNKAQEQEYLHAYFGEPAGDHRQARFCLMLQACHIVYATCFLSLAAAAGQSIAPEDPVPDFDEFHRRIISGEVDLMNAHARAQYGMVHLTRALENMQTARLAEAMALVANSPAAAD